MHKRKANYGERSAPQAALFVVDYVQKCNCTNYEVPTGNLDSRTGIEVVGLLKASAEAFHQTILLVTHNEEIAQMADRIIRIEDGKVR